MIPDTRLSPAGKTTLKIAFTVAMATFLLGSCWNFRDDEVEKTIKINKEIYAYMKDIYLWNTSIPTVSYSAYDSPGDFMEALLYKPRDRWSILLTTEDFNQYFEEGQMIGHGFLMGMDNLENIRVALIYPQSKAYKDGVRRGWIIKKVNNVDATADNISGLLGEQEIGIRNTFEFLNNNNEIVVLSLIKEEVKLSPVLFSHVIDYGGKKIGYMVFQDFIDAANEELDSVFASFRTAGIEDLIIDLRYNGGGSVDVAEYMSGWLLGSTHTGAPLVKFKHNSNNSQYDTTVNIPNNASGFGFDRYFFIATENTASASEMVINGIKPYGTSYITGTRTHGKPVGMYAIPLTKGDYFMLPVSFRYTNAADSGDFYDGLPASFNVADDITRDFGDTEEDCLESTLNYITTGHATYTSAKSAGPVRYLMRTDAIGEFLKAF